MVVVATMAAFLEVLFAFLCTCGACAVALLHIYRHLCNYTEPIYQRYTVRIILMVPVSALADRAGSWSFQCANVIVVCARGVRLRGFLSVFISVCVDIRIGGWVRAGFLNLVQTVSCGFEFSCGEGPMSSVRVCGHSWLR